MPPAEEFKQRNTRPASVLNVGGFRPTMNILASNMCRAPVGLANETWPVLKAVPLAFVCQMNLTDAPAVPDLLRDIALLTFFVSPEDSDLGRENGDGWILRAYKSLEGLATLVPPPNVPKTGKAFECAWEKIADHPNHDDPERVSISGARTPRSGFENVARTKVGGYASTIQSEPWWGYDPHPAQPRFCLQINSEEKAQLAWGDGGTLYIARGTAPGTGEQWYLDWQCF
jgi:uncharacterized protein YwqG